MALFSDLSNKLNNVFSKLSSHGRLTEQDIKTAMREVRIVLLEADVNLTVAKEFIARVSERAVGQEIIKSLSPSQQVVKIVNEELIDLMGEENSKIEFNQKPPTVIMMAGLQGAGKTTFVGKLGFSLKKQGKKPLLVACDVYRPAAINQLKVVGEKAGVEVFEKGQGDPIAIAKEGVDYAKQKGYDVVIIDTAGRLQIDENLMKELERIKDEVHPDEILLTVDAMTGQVAVEVADTFNRRLEISGLVLTKLDGDTRGGSTLSMKAITGKPIKFCSVGEKLGDLEPFYPERMANRILGLGDVLTLAERAQEAVSEEEARELGKKIKENTFTLDDYLAQFETMNKMGGIKSVLSMMPTMGLGNNMKIKEEDIDERKILMTKAIIQSMTMEERENPQIINSSRKTRIAKGCGQTVQDVNKLLKQFEQTKLMMKQMKNNKMFRF